MNNFTITAHELEEDRRMVATLKSAGLTEYEACMLTAQIKQVTR